MIISEPRRFQAELEDEDCQPSPAKTRCQSCPEQPDPCQFRLKDYKLEKD